MPRPHPHGDDGKECHYVPRSMQVRTAMYILTGLTKFTMFETVYVKYATEPTQTKMFNTFCKIRKKTFP